MPKSKKPSSVQVSRSETEKLIQEALDQGCMSGLRRLDLPSYIYMCYKQWYYKGEPIVSDAAFDRYEDLLKDLWATNPVLRAPGSVFPTCKCCKAKGRGRRYVEVRCLDCRRMSRFPANQPSPWTSGLCQDCQKKINQRSREVEK